jgi:hypothetical protein
MKTAEELEQENKKLKAAVTVAVSAGRTLLASVDKRLSEHTALDPAVLRKHEAELDSQREANQRLTDENLTLAAQVLKMRDYIAVAADQLNNVRTGGDFECECWQIAEAVQKIPPATAIERFVKAAIAQADVSLLGGPPRGFVEEYDEAVVEYMAAKAVLEDQQK